MDERLEKVNLINELDFTFVDVEKQLSEDQERWGDTWKERGLVFNEQSQEVRWFYKMQDYFQAHINEGQAIPWDKVIGEAHICKVREKKLKEIE
jgi:hypothetical protein